jgi:hypothetical protein
MEQRIEYAVADQDGVIQLVTGTDRERAFAMAGRFNRGRDGASHFTVMDRTVTTTDWKPANTGVVPPYITENKE